jgi:hypothetical protein
MTKEARKHEARKEKQESQLSFGHKSFGHFFAIRISCFALGILLADFAGKFG